MEKNLLGKPIAAEIKTRVADQIAQIGKSPVMLLIQVGSDPASAYYVQNIIKTGRKLGCEVRFLELPAEAREKDLKAEIQAANSDPEIHGIMLQKPLPRGFDSSRIDLLIDPTKDVDGIHPMNLGKIMLGSGKLLPCTAAAVIETLVHYDIKTQGKNVVILGRSTVLGKPLANLLIQKGEYADATLTICHSKTQNIEFVTRNADILIAAIGVPNFVRAEMIKAGAVLIDVGINLITAPDGALIYVGDIDYNDCYDKALAITPVPGGIGTITTAVLFENLIKTMDTNAELNKSIDDFS